MSSTRLDAQIAVYLIFKENDLSFKRLGYRAEIVTETPCGRLFQSRTFKKRDAAIEDLLEQYAEAGYEGILKTVPDEQGEALRVYGEWWRRYSTQMMQKRKTQKRRKNSLKAKNRQRRKAE